MSFKVWAGGFVIIALLILLMLGNSIRITRDKPRAVEVQPVFDCIPAHKPILDPSDRCLLDPDIDCPVIQ